MDACAHFPENCKPKAQHFREIIGARKGCGGKDWGALREEPQKRKVCFWADDSRPLSGRLGSVHGLWGPGFLPHLSDPYIWELFLFPNVPVMFPTFSSSQSSKQQTHCMKKRVMMKLHPSWGHLQRWTLSPSSPFNVESWMCEPQATYPHPLPFVIQLLSRVRLFVTHGLQHIRLPSLPLSPGVCSNACPLSQWCHPNISSPVTPFSLFQYQGLFQWVSSLYQVDKVVELNCLLWTLH